MTFAEMGTEYYNTYQEKDPWLASPFYDIKCMANDVRGDFGEDFIYKAFLTNPENIIQMPPSKNNKHPDGIYDLKVNNKRIEVKTSCYSRSYQHEPLYQEPVCDITICLDININDFYITVVPSKEIPCDRASKLFPGRKATLRKSKTDGYKFDFSNTTIQQGLKNGITRHFTNNFSFLEIESFIKERLKVCETI